MKTTHIKVPVCIPLLKAYVLHFPNLEVREGMISGLMPLILKRTTADGKLIDEQKF